jgi:hypothetical protein
MRTIKAPDYTTALEELKTALTYKNETFKYKLEADEEKIINAIYEEYEKVKGAPSDNFKSNMLSNPTNKALHDAYDETQDGRRLEELRSRILLSVTRCPFCGISDADELDHHLPRSIYQAISTYPLNLIPLCHKCNNKKRTVTGENIEERFTHVYFDNFPDFPLLLADVVIVNDSLSIHFKIEKNGISDLLFKQLSFQIGRINLNNRLKKECNIYLSSIGSIIETTFGTGNAESLKDLLISQSNENKRIFGLNDWRAIFLLSLANCEDFCNGGFKAILNKLYPQ